jgi:hypothetical protein
MSHIDVQSAARAVGHKVGDPDVQNMMQMVATGEGGPPFSEASLKKARTALNSMIEKGWEGIDDKIMECKGFEDMNRNNFGQVTLDIARLTQQINDLERVESEAVEGINIKDQEIHSVEELLERETSEYNQDYAANSAQLTIYQNDMDVFQFIMEFTKCPGMDANAQYYDELKSATGLYQICRTESGTRVLRFHDKAHQAKYDKMLTPQAMRRLDRLLASVESPSLIQGIREEEVNETEAAINASVKAMKERSMVNNVPLSQREGVVNGATPFEINVKCDGQQCQNGDECCGILHDKLSMMWGEHKDKVDELTMIMMKNHFEFEDLKSNLNMQIDSLKTAKARLMELLAEARSNLAADNSEKESKNAQKRDLDQDYHEYMAKCKPELWYVCALITVRNAVHENSTDCPPAKFQDCDVGNWVPGECSVPCDDSCDPKHPYKCGGWQELKRDIVVNDNDCVAHCPRTSIMKRCGQYKCPVDCIMSAWSGWSKCSAECNGGVRGRTRSIAIKPKNGGLSCNTVEDQEPCGTISCDRNCYLAKWTDWTPCSQACDAHGQPGFKERRRHVLIPTRGYGKCPHDDSHDRYQHTTCNEQPCRGDEDCMAKQDLVICIDGSGSVKPSGFKILQEFVGKLLERYMTQYWGDDAVKLAIVLFGNGVIMPDGKTVAPALLKQGLTFEMDDVKKAVKELKFKKGFTNMAQAFAVAETAFILGSRREASSAVMVITDGKPSFKFMTNEMVEQLDDKGITRYFLLVNDEDLDSDANKVMKSWASQPWETNLIHVPGGLTLLEADMDLWAASALVKFCPMAMSPTDMEWEEANFGYSHVKDGAYCGYASHMISSDADSADACAALASGAACESFILGVSWARGRCYCGTMKVDQTQYLAWQKERENPECPAAEGGWRSSALYDFYSMEPPEDTTGR